ncbi:DUF2157 domain-containing protein [Comamonas sp. NLF-1-9]|uniref:DUF2157 domain-containing protein n=1 Tax=Comamonas sp. NLF-1-9 TaxID=2853163 RepID=UPI001C4698D1|nr:DUF2157 domain-containing protein [Comamonas sp. NLF-1-9]QXL84348.1 DUF2157 domain-containing protein [Comamonas sp. NLF-1-9]
MHTFIEALIRQHALDAAQARQLWQLARLQAPPAQLRERLQRALAVVAALLLGAALIFWVAANWQHMALQTRLHLLEAAVLAPALLLALIARAHTALLLLATLALGALLAFVGQTWQTGADAWQLFAIWALLALPWALLARHDGLWALWLLIAGAALFAWSGAPLGLQVLWAPDGPTPLHRYLELLLWAALFLLPLALRAGGLMRQPRPALSWPIAALMALSAWSAGGILNLVGRHTDAQFGLCALLIAGALLLAWRRQPRQYGVLALALMAANAMVLSTLGWWLFQLGNDFAVGPMLLLTLAAAASTGLSLRWLYRLQARDAQA